MRLIVCDPHDHRLRQAPGARHSRGRADLRPRRTPCSTRSASGSATIRSTTDQLPFVYEKNLKVLPTMAVVLGWPGFWARDLDTGIDWVKLVAGEQGLTLHRPLAPRGTVVGKTRVTEIIDKGAGQGRAGLFRARVDDQATGERIATIDADHVLPRRRRLRRPAARSRRPVHADPGARARSRLRPADAAGDGADLPAERRSQPAACRSRGGARRRASRARSCMGLRPSASPATPSSRACAATIRRGSRRSPDGSRRRYSPARPSAPRCGATAAW